MSAIVRLRLQRWGVRNHPHYRIVAAHREAKRDGRFLEVLGNYNPIPDPKTGLKQLQVKKDRTLYWIAVGAQPSSRVAWLLGKAGLIPEAPTPVGKTLSAQPKKKAQERLAAAAKKKEEAAAKADPSKAKPATSTAPASPEKKATPA